MLYAVELMPDNHKEMCERLGVDINHPHYVCHDALTYDYDLHLECCEQGFGFLTLGKGTF
jgi:hypothetical protein